MAKQDTLVPRNTKSRLPQIVEKRETALLKEWVARQKTDVNLRSDLVSEEKINEQSRQFLAAFRSALQDATWEDVDGAGWEEVLALLESLSRTRAQQGFSARETALFIFSLKEPLALVVREEIPEAAAQVAELWSMMMLLDQLGLRTTEMHQKAREQVIARQQQELLDLSTPVVTLWEDVLALPLIGTLDSARTQITMESLLERLSQTGAQIAIIDITGVPTVDTLVAQHLMKTVAAARLMGADCIISGIRPQIAQTIVHLGVDLGDVITKATLAEAFRLALVRTGRRVVAANAAAAPNGRVPASKPDASERNGTG